MVMWGTQGGPSCLIVLSLTLVVSFSQVLLIMKPSKLEFHEGMFDSSRIDSQTQDLFDSASDNSSEV